MPITFDNSFVFNHGRPQTVEEAIITYCSWGRLQQFSFFDFLSEASREPSGMYIYENEPVGTDFTLHYRVESVSEHGIVFLYLDENNYWTARIENTNFLVHHIVSGTSSLIFSLPITAYSTGDFTWAVRQQTFSSDETDIWICVSCWVNHKLVATHGQYVGTPQILDYYPGVICPSGTMLNIRIPQLKDFVEWASLDPGEPLAGGLERMLEGRYVRYYLRHNGHVRAWRSKPLPTSFEFDEDEIELLSTTIDRRSVVTHVRLLGAFVEAEEIDVNLMSSYGHRFQEVQNPYLMTERECLHEARRAIIRALEGEISESASSAYTPLIEPEDRVDTPQGPRIVDRIDRSTTQAGTVDQTLSMRRYAQGS